MSDDLTSRAINAAISDIEDATKHLIHAQDSITLAQFRRIKLARHVLADFLVVALKVEAEPKPAADAPGDRP